VSGMARPPKPEGTKALRVAITYPPQLEAKVKALQAQKKLSGVCQRAIKKAKL